MNQSARININIYIHITHSVKTPFPSTKTNVSLREPDKLLLGNLKKRISNWSIRAQ